jgi:hypothetical protein
VFNETLIHFSKEFGNRIGASASSYGSTSGCQLCQVDDHIAMACRKHNDISPNAANVVEDIGLRTVA